MIIITFGRIRICAPCPYQSSCLPWLAVELQDDTINYSWLPGLKMVFEMLMWIFTKFGTSGNLLNSKGFFYGRSIQYLCVSFIINSPTTFTQNVRNLLIKLSIKTLLMKLTDPSQAVNLVENNIHIIYITIEIFLKLNKNCMRKCTKTEIKIL